uniref:(northern house mosquito) hypothetical protein n=1 Tax=Culex pipiens TaxID=7175 RepID=A0A8D8JZP7_CULPI
MVVGVVFDHPGPVQRFAHQAFVFLANCEASFAVDGGESFRSVRLSAALQVVCCRRMSRGHPSRGQRTESITICRSSNANQQKKSGTPPSDVSHFGSTCCHTYTLHTYAFANTRAQFTESKRVGVETVVCLLVLLQSVQGVRGSLV